MMMGFEMDPSKTFSNEKGRNAKERNDPTSLSQPVHDPGDLLAKKFCPTGCWVTNAVRVNTKLLELRCGDFSQCDDLFPRK